MGIVLLRLIVVALVTAGGAALGRRMGVEGGWLWVGGAGLGAGLLAVALERRARGVPVDQLFWGTLGGLAGVGVGVGLGAALGVVFPGGGGLGRSLLAMLLGYLGLSVALAKREDLAGVSAKLFPRHVAGTGGVKILDTSVIIDGRVGDVVEAGFLEGTLVVPQFVLRELQQIADSSDALKRNRGKRGFDVLQRLQRSPRATVRIDERDVPGVREVDRKLIELAKMLGGKVVTNDYNLNKVAELSGVGVLNLNELASAVKPVVLPGELIQLHVLREGKEAGQGVAYLDDGTMVVVDHGRRFIGQTVDAAVTSVLQTTGGRMIFARPVPGEEPGSRS
jgi:uncharacterized protein YacL